VSCTYWIWSCGLTSNLRFWMPTVNFNKRLAECQWLTKLTGYVRYVYKFILSNPMNKTTRWFKYDRDCLCVNLATSVLVIFEPPCIYYLLNVIYCIINYEKFGHNFYQTNTKLKHKELFKLWIQKKGEHSNIKNEYIQNSDTWMYRYFCF